MTTLVTGSRGAVARNLLALLRERGLPARPASSNPQDSGTITCDLTDPTTFAAALDGVTSVFLYAEHSHIDAFVKQAAHAGVEHIVLLSSSSVLDQNADSSPLARHHLDVERALTASTIRTTILRPGSFAGNALSWAWSVKSGRPVSLPYPGAHTDPIHEADIAEAALATLTDPALSGRPHLLTGPESLTFSRQIDILARVTGLPFAARQVTVADWKAEVAEYIPAAFADALIDWWRSCDGVPATITTTVEELTGHPARTFATWADDHRADFS